MTNNIEFKTGNIFKYEFDLILNPVNCVGVMGKGLAAQFKNKYPFYFDNYKRDCDSNLIKPGEVTLFKLFYEKYKFICNFPTKLDWAEPSKIEWIEDGLNDLLKKIKLLDIKSIGIPALGCGNGKLEWVDVKELLIKFAEKIPHIKVTVFEPK